MRTIDLLDGWTVSPGPQEHLVPDAVPGATIPASVPGSVHRDLMAAGLLEDPYFGRNELLVQWVGDTEWIYRKRFHLDEPAEDHVDLVFEGLDTVAVVELNDVEVARTFNQHRTYRIDVAGRLRVGDNLLQVRFLPVRDHALALRAGLGDRPRNFPEPYNFVRKSAANFGWDWGPNLVTAGIWKPARLEAWHGARLATVLPHLTVEGGEGVVDLDVETQAASDGALTLEVAIGHTRRSFDVEPGRRQRVSVRLPEVGLWWPRGLGEQKLYPLDLRLVGADGAELDSWSRKVGFRTVEHRTGTDEPGREYTLVVNGVPIFARGANWIPDDCFVAGVDRARYRKRIQQAEDANVNLLRVWGGGIYEKDDFYDLCDEAGMLVTQDFLFACAAYPEEEPIRTEVELEARDNITRLMTHPSLVLWNGSNENIWGYFDWGWREPLEDRTWGLGYYLDLLPALVEELDPSTPYWASSPYSGSMDLHPNDSGHGNQHLWDVWNTVDYLHYADTRPRFVSEFGFQGPANWATIRESVAEDPLRPDGVELLHHQKAPDGNGKLARGMANHLPEPADFDEWHYLTQLNQAKAVAFGVEYLRSLRPVCMGAIVWQLNDCWPVTSWAAVDGAGRLKPLWYELRRVFADRLITIQPGDSGVAREVVLVNDGPSTWSGTLHVSRFAVTGAALAGESARVEVPPFSSIRVALSPDTATPEDPALEGLQASIDGQRTIRFFREDRDMRFGRASYSVRAERSGDRVVLTVEAHTLTRDLIVAADRVDSDAVVDTQVVTLLPGESHTFEITTSVASDDPAWQQPSVVRAVNDSAHYD
jgi:beta-mannosidase